MSATAKHPAFGHRHLLGIADLSPPEIHYLLDKADEAVAVSRQVNKKKAVLKGRTQINLFFEASTRTQSSFELAGKRLGADVMNMAVAASSVKKGETLIDTAMTLNAMRPDLLIVRHGSAGSRGAAGAEGRLLGDQCRRRRARAPDAGAARCAHHAPPQGRALAADRGDLRRRAAFARGALEHPAAQRGGRAGARDRARRRCCPPASSGWAWRSSAAWRTG